MRELEPFPATGLGRPGPGRILRRFGARRWRRGFSLFGVLLGLGLAAVVIVGAVGTYNAAASRPTAPPR